MASLQSVEMLLSQDAYADESTRREEVELLKSGKTFVVGARH
jgi:hypothetical protein